jgi:hypothetical protein
MVVLYSDHSHWHDYCPRTSRLARIDRRPSVESACLPPDPSSLPPGGIGRHGEELDIGLAGRDIGWSWFSFSKVA